MKADTQTIDILLLGSGGREHALAAKLAASPRAGKLYIAPGNGGTASCGENVVLDDCDPAAVAAFAQSHGCGLVVIGPEAPLVAGVADAVRAAGIPCFGPGPITTSPHPWLCANAATAAGSQSSRTTFSPQFAVPPLPGAM